MGSNMALSHTIKGLYAIVDDSCPNPAGRAQVLIKEGCRLIQLRAKRMSTAEFLETAREIKKICFAGGAALIINDRIDIAMAVEADGVHIGQDDFPVREARRLIGSKILGVSTHSQDEALTARKAGADYIGFGPVFETDTKPDAQAEKGLAPIAGIKSRVPIPLVAIGGIKKENMIDVIRAGADAVAMISELANEEDIKEIIYKLDKEVTCHDVH